MFPMLYVTVMLTTLRGDKLGFWRFRDYRQLFLSSYCLSKQR